MLKKLTLLGFAMFAMCWQIALSQTANFTIDQGNTICVNECITITDLSTSPVNITNWDWVITSTCPSIPVIPNPAGQDPGTICFSEPCTYLIELSITDANGNVANANVQLNVVVCPGSLSAGFSSKSTVCENECMTMTDTTQGTPTSWQWDVTPVTATIPGSSTDQHPTFCFLNATTNDPVEVELTVTNADGKISKFTKQIDVAANPTVIATIGTGGSATKDTIIELGYPAILHATAMGASKYLWEPSSSVTNPKALSTFAYPDLTTEYIVTARDGNGCFAKDTVKVFLNFIPQIGVPTAFTPNGDGKNDLLAVNGLALTTCIFKVYNRYGIQVFESTVQKNGWDGNFKGKPEDPGVFHWTLEYVFNTGKRGVLSGNTTLVR